MTTICLDNLEDTIRFDRDGKIFFCGDDLYGHYDFDELLSLAYSILNRVYELKRGI